MLFDTLVLLVFLNAALFTWRFNFTALLLWVAEVPQGSTRPSLQVLPPFFTVVLSCVYPAAQSLWCVLDKRQAVNSNWLQLPSTAAIKMLSLHVLVSTGPFYPLSLLYLNDDCHVPLLGLLTTQEMLFNAEMNQTWPVNFSCFSYMNNLDRIAGLDYVPTEQDVLRVRFPTTGIHDYSFTIKTITLRWRPWYWHSKGLILIVCTADSSWSHFHRLAQGEEDVV